MKQYQPAAKRGILAVSKTAGTNATALRRHDRVRVCGGWCVGLMTAARNAPRAFAPKHWRSSTGRKSARRRSPEPMWIRGPARSRCASFYRDWSTRQVWVRGTRLGMNRAVEQTTFGDVPLAELRRSHFEQWVKSMDDRGLAPSTISTYYTNVRAVIGAALRERLLGHDVGHRVKLPRQPKDKDKMRLPTPRGGQGVAGGDTTGARGVRLAVRVRRFATR